VRGRSLVLPLAICALACGGVQVDVPTPQVTNSPTWTPPPGAGAQAVAADPDLALATKLDHYVKDCLNAFTPRALDSEARYYQWVDPATGPTGKESIVYGLYTLNFEATRCSKAARDAAAAGPSLPELEAAADQYVIALEILHKRIEDANDYYDAEDYEDDGMKKGIEMHGPLSQAWKDFRAADEALSAQVGALEAEVQVKALERARTEGDGRRVLLIECYLAARPLAQTVATVRIDDQGVPVADAAALEAQIEVFDKAVDALATYGNEVGWGTSVADDGKEMLSSAKKLLRKVKGREPYEGFDRRTIGTFGGWMIEGSPDQVVDAYEDFVDSYNSLVESPLAQLPARRASWTPPR
jgi:hypothetical protein